MRRTKKKGGVKTNKVIFLLDASGSMGHLSRKASEVYTNLVKGLKDRAKRYGQKTEVSLYDFDNQLITHYTDVDVKDVKPLSNYRVRGGTAMFDAVGSVLSSNDLIHDYKEDVSFLVFVLTDGQENASFKYNGHSLSALIKKLQATDAWTITFQVPAGDKSVLTRLGIPSGNISEWEQSEEGLEEVEHVTSGGLDQYYLARSTNQRSIQTFYTNPANVALSKVKKALVDVSNEFQAFSVTAEVQIKDFVENTAGKVYKKGEGFYQLTKPEIVQSYKDILIYDKKHRQLYAGHAARNLIGLPVGTDAKVVPGNHGQYEIFVASTSVNRKLKAGTKLLVKK